MDKTGFAKRTKQFAINVFKYVECFPKTEATRVITYQLLKAASSVAANYRSATRAKSKADFVNKLKIVVEEADESNFWLTFSAEVGLTSDNDPRVNTLIQESDELTAIFSASLNTLRSQTSVKSKSETQSLRP